MKEEALKLADILEGSREPTGDEIFESADMIRKLVAELDKQGEPVALMHPTNKNSVIPINTFHSKIGTSDWLPLYTAPQTKPLSDEEILQLVRNRFGDKACIWTGVIEERDGIK